MFDGSTVSQGSKATINGQTVSVGQSGVQIGTTTISADPAASSADPAGSATNDPGTTGATVVVTANGQTLTAVKYSGSTIIAAGLSTVTLSQNDPATISGQQVSVVSGGSGLVVNGGSTATFAYQAPSSSPSQIVTIGSSAYTVAQTSDTRGSSAIVVAAGGSTATLPAGQTTTFGGQTIIAPSTGGAVIGSGSLAATVKPVSTPTTLAGGSHSGSTVLYSGSSSLQVIQAGSSVVFAGASSTVTLAQGASTIIAGHTVAAASSNGGAVVDGSSIGLSAPAATGTIAVVTGSAGRQVTVSQQGSSIVLAAGTSTIMLAQGSSTTFAGVSVAADPGAGGVVVGSSTIPLGRSSPLATQAVVTASNGQQITAVQQGSSVVVAVGGSSITVAQGLTTMLAGQTIAADSGGTGVVVDGSTVLLTTPTLASSGAVFTGSAGQSITVLQQGSSYVVQDGTSTLALPAGSATSVDGITISAPSTGGAPVVNGQSVTLSSLATITSGLATEAVFTGSASQLATVLQMGSSFVIQDGSSTTTLGAGSSATFGGHTISVPTSGGTALIDGSALPFSTATHSTIAVGKLSSATTSYNGPASSASSAAGTKSPLASSGISVKTTSISWLVGSVLLLSVITGCCM